MLVLWQSYCFEYTHHRKRWLYQTFGGAGKRSCVPFLFPFVKGGALIKNIRCIRFIVTSGNSAGTEVWRPWPASPDGPTVIQISTRKLS